VPELPTAKEAGLAGYEYSTWYGMLAPAGTPRGMISRIHTDLVAQLKSPEVVERFSSQGLDVEAGTPAEFTTFVKSELEKWRSVVRTAGLRVQ
jgi:tripartite-type tricarboxylate transporter receptor subunit TctC